MLRAIEGAGVLLLLSLFFTYLLAPIVGAVRRRVRVGRRQRPVSGAVALMLIYLTILASALCGYTAMPIWTVAAATIALASLSISEHYGLYKRGSELGLFRQVDETFFRSIFNSAARISSIG